MKEYRSLGFSPGDKVGGLAAVLQAQQPVPTAAATAARAWGAFVAGWAWAGCFAL